MENTLTTIIEKAISGGWLKQANPEIIIKDGVFVRLETWGGGDINDKSKEQIFMSKTFWSSLGKACGWDNGYDYMGTMIEQEWVEKALYFYELNLTTSFEEAVAWLGKVVEG